MNNKLWLEWYLTAQEFETNKQPIAIAIAIEENFDFVVAQIEN